LALPDLNGEVRARNIPEVCRVRGSLLRSQKCPGAEPTGADFKDGATRKNRVAAIVELSPSQPTMKSPPPGKAERLKCSVFRKAAANAGELYTRAACVALIIFKVAKGDFMKRFPNR
jgi:hypothetical protein